MVIICVIIIAIINNISLLNVNWFKANKNRKKHTFSVFNTLQFYPSIERHLPKKAISFPKKHVAFHHRKKR